MMKILLKTVCDDAFHTKENGNLNIVGIFENIGAEKFPARHPKMTFVFIIETDTPGAEIGYTLDIADVEGKKIFDTKSKPASLKVGINGRGHLVVNLRMIEFPHEGVYAANFYFGQDKQQESLNFNVQNPQR